MEGLHQSNAWETVQQQINKTVWIQSPRIWWEAYESSDTFLICQHHEYHCHSMVFPSRTSQIENTTAFTVVTSWKMFRSLENQMWKRDGITLVNYLPAKDNKIYAVSWKNQTWELITQKINSCCQLYMKTRFIQRSAVGSYLLYSES